MAKKSTGLEEIFKRTEPGESEQDNSDLDSGNIQSTGVGLREGEITALDQIASELEVSRNAVLRFAVRWFLLKYRSGDVDLSGYVEAPPPPRKQLRLPGQE